MNLLAWVKRSGRNVGHQSPSSGEIKERVELYIYSHAGLSWSSRVNFTLIFCNKMYVECYRVSLQEVKVILTFQKHARGSEW